MRLLSRWTYGPGVLFQFNALLKESGEGLGIFSVGLVWAFFFQESKYAQIVIRGPLAHFGFATGFLVWAFSQKI